MLIPPEQRRHILSLQCPCPRAKTPGFHFRKREGRFDEAFERAGPHCIQRSLTPTGRPACIHSGLSHQPFVYTCACPQIQGKDIIKHCACRHIARIHYCRVSERKLFFWLALFPNVLIIIPRIQLLSCDSVWTLSGRGETPHKGRRLPRDYVLHVPWHSQHPVRGFIRHWAKAHVLHSRGPSHEMAA